MSVLTISPLVEKSKSYRDAYIRYYLKSKIDTWQRDIFIMIEAWFSESPFIMANTSGTTAEAKSIKLTKKDIEISAVSTLKKLKMQRGQSVFVCLPMDYIAGKMMVFRGLIGGLRIMAVKPSQTPLKELDSKVELAAMTPHQVCQSLCQNIDKVNKLLIGGGKVQAELSKKLRNTKAIIYETYGMTETISHIALRQITPQNESNFQTLPGISVYVDEKRCLCINDRRFSVEKHITTRDIVKIISRDSFQWLGRFDNVINSGGIKIVPEELEKKLSQHITQTFFIHKEPDTKLGERVVLMIESSIEKLPRIDLLYNLHQYERPKKIYRVDNFKRTASGKIKRIETFRQCSKEWVLF